MIKLSVCFILFIVLLVDLIIKFKKDTVVQGLRGWGFISPVYLSVIGALAIVVSVAEWVGWVVFVLCAFISTEMLNFLQADTVHGGSNSSKISSVLKNKDRVCSIVAFCGVLCCGDFLCSAVAYFLFLVE